MFKFTNSLENIKIASPCAADWNEMIGDHQKRFCGACQLNVYNLSGMSRREAENLIVRSEGRLCIRFYKRPDGSVLTKDCPVGWQAIRRNISKTATAFASLIFTALSGIGLASYFAKPNPQVSGEMLPIVESLATAVNPIEKSNSNASIEEQSVTIMGNVALPIQKNEEEQFVMEGGISNLPEMRAQIKSNRRR